MHEMYCDFPRIAEAVEACRIQQDNIWRKKYGAPSAYKRAVRVWQDASNNAANLYAEELAPALFGGRWELTRPPENVADRSLAGIEYAASVSSHFGGSFLSYSLRALRRIGSKFPASWEDTFFIAEPYRVFDSGGAPSWSAWDDAEIVRRERRAAVWARKDLSVRHPDSCLVVVSRLLLDRDARGYGFINLGI